MSSERGQARAGHGSLDPLFRPTAVAVVGASRDAHSIGRRVLHNLLASGFAGPVFPVNPCARVVASMPCYPNVASIPHPVDLAVIAVPARLVAEIADECARSGVKALIVLSAGFAEIGAEGADLQAQLVARVRTHGMRMIGPNCIGLLHTDPEVRLNATFAPQLPEPGRIAMSSQSGALGLAVLDRARELGLGLRAFVSVGNRADVSSNDLLEYWCDDPNVDLVLLYLESFGNPRHFRRIARAVARKKPILAVKSGRSAVGARAASSHTAALASSEAGASALLAQAGVLRADTLEEMFDVAALLANEPLPPGNRVAILTNSGGPAILCADACDAHELTVPPLAASTQSRLREFLPVTASVTNPVDMVAAASAEDYARAVPVLLEDPSTDAVVVIYTAVDAGEGAAVVRAVHEARAARERKKPLVACFLGAQGLASSVRDARGTLPVYAFPEAAARALGKAAQRSRWLKEPEGETPALGDLDIERARLLCEGQDGWLLPDAVHELLRCFGIRSVETALCTTADEAAKAARRYGFPVAVKLASRTLVHKSEWNGVHLDLRDEAAVRGAFAAIRERLTTAGKLAELAGVSVQPMARPGVECIVGMVEDASLGPLIAFGLGGIAVELLHDVVFRITPLTDRDARAMLEGIKGRKLLEGYRGTPVVDQDALADLLLRVSALADALPQVKELDLNPVRAFPRGEGALVLDARIRCGGEIAPRGSGSPRCPD